MAKAKQKKPQERKQKQAVLTSLLPANPPTEALTAVTEDEVVEVRKFGWLRLQLIGPIVFGFFIFLFGLIFFLPINELAWEGVRYLQGEGVPVEIEDVDLGLFGGLEINNLKFAMDTNSDSTIAASKIEADLSTWSLLLGNDLKVSDLQIINLTYRQGPIYVGRGDWQGKIDIENFRKAEKDWRGQVRIVAKDVQASYDEVLPIINKKLDILVKNLVIQGSIGGRVLRLQPTQNVITTNLGIITLAGSMTLGNSPLLTVKISISPQGELKTMLQEQKDFFNAPGLGLSYLLDDPIEFNASGSLKNIKLDPIKKIPETPMPNMGNDDSTQP